MKTRHRLRTLAMCFSALAPLCLCALPARAETAPAMLLQADQASYDTKSGIVVASGHVEVEYQGRILLADTLTYDQKADRITASGHVSLMDETGNVAFAKHVVLHDKMREGALEGFGALIGKYGRMAATSANRRAGRYTEARNAVYSNCKICNTPGMSSPLWQIKAVRVAHDNQTHRIAFKDATVELLGVPALYTPYLRVPDPSVHYSSGFLTPESGSSSAIGYFLRVPYYVSISESEDATLAPLISTRGGMVMMGEYRKRWADSGLWLQGSFAENPNGGLHENHQQFYSHLFGSGRFGLSQPWQAGFDVQVSSKDTYLRRYDITLADRLMSDLFVVGQRGRSRFAVTGYFFQSLRSSDNNNTIPIALPMIEYTYIPLDKWLGGQFRFDVNAVALSRDIGANTQRITARTRWRFPLIASDGEMWTFQLDARGDGFHTDTPAPLPSDSHWAFRGVPTATLDWRWPFIARGQGGRSIIVEPIAQVIAAPFGGNPRNLPNEDSYGLEVDDNNIFSFDRVPGYDLVESGPRANVGFRAESRFDSGYAEALIGQTFRLKSDPIFTSDSSGQSGTASDIVGRFSIKFPPYMDLTQRFAYNQKTGKVRRNEAYLTATYGRSSAQINYVQLSPSEGVNLATNSCAGSAEPNCLPAREEVNAQVDLNFYRNWQVFAAIRRDLIADQTLSTQYGLGYENECLGVSLSYRQKFTSDRDLKPSTAIILHFNLKTSDLPIRPFSLFPQDVFSYTRN